LQKGNWKERKTKYDGLYVFAHAANGAEIVLSKEDSSNNFDYNIDDAIRIISLIEEKHPKIIKHLIKNSKSQISAN
jgi:hypothetical protein